MKKTTAIIIFLLLAIPCIFSQNNNGNISYSQENSDSSDYNYKRKYMYLDINMKEENSMLSIALAPNTMFNTAGYYGSNYSMSLVSKFDKKISPSYSLYSEILGLYSNSSNEFLYTNAKRFKAAINFGLRYYYNQKKNINMGIAASNFNGPYLDIKANSVFSYDYYDLNHFRHELSNSIIMPESSKGNDHKLFFLNSYSLAIGYQNKLTKYIFMDGNVFFDYQYGNDDHIDNNLKSYYSGISMGLCLKFGFGWGWK